MMEITISNKITVKNFSLALIDYCQRNLVLDNPEYHIAEKMGRWTGNIQKYLHLYEVSGSNLILPFGEIDNIWNDYILNKTDNINYDFAPIQALKMVGNVTLYPYQQNAVQAMVAAKNGILEAPCGSGKTQMGVALIGQLGQKALWVTHTTDLLKQSLARAKQYYPNGDFGTITDGKVHIGADITFATVQTLSNLDLWQYQKEWNVLIVDECHRAAGTPTKVKQFYKVISSIKARHKYGLSATLDRADGLIKSVFAILGKIRHKVSEQEVGDKIIKAQHIVVSTDLEDVIEQYSGTDGTMVYAKLIDYISGNDDRNNLIARTIALRPVRHHLVLSHRVEHLRALKRLLDALNVKAHILVGTTPKVLREEILEKMKSGEIRVLLATYSLAKEGLDIPILDTLHLVTPNKNKSIVLQSVGRIERNLDGKAKPEVYDYLDIKIGYCAGMGRIRKRIIERRN